MSTNRLARRKDVLEVGIEEIKLENRNTSSDRARSRTDVLKEGSPNVHPSSPRDVDMESASQSPVKKESSTQSSTASLEKHEETVGGEITVKMEPGQPLKLSRSVSQKVVAGPPPLFNDYEDKVEEARGYFDMIPSCIYSNKYIGSTEHGSMDCDCVEEWGKTATISLISQLLNYMLNKIYRCR